MSRCFITGAAGFIGGNLGLALLAAGHEVTGFDNLSTGSIENCRRLAANGGDRWRFVEGDVRDGAMLRTAVDGADVVVHLAAQVSVQASFDDVLHNEAVNGAGFLNALTAAGECGVRLFVYASSCAVYGDNEHLPLGEAQPPRPLSPYAATKLLNEHYAAAMAPRLPGMALFGMRLFNVFGPGQSADGGYAAVIPRWLACRRAGEVPELFGDGGQTRDFCHVDNVAALVGRLIAHPPAPGHHLCNVGTGIQTSLIRLDQIICRSLAAAGHAGPFSAPHFRPARGGDIRHSVGDIQRVRTYGFRVETDLEAGIMRLAGGRSPEV